MRSTRTMPLILGALALAAAGTAHAGLVSFEDPLDSPFLFDGDNFNQQGYAFQAQDLGGTGGFAGTIIDGSDPSTCFSVSCPVNNSSKYYGSVNDGILRMRNGNGNPMRLWSFDAAFLGASAEPLPPVSGLLRVQGQRADGSFVTAQFLLPGPTDGNLNFSSVLFNNGTVVGGTGSLGDEFTQLFFFGFACNAGGSCDAFTTNRGQFAIDNIAVPEPSQWALVGLSLAAMGVVTRRSKQQRKPEQQPSA